LNHANHLSVGGKNGRRHELLDHLVVQPRVPEFYQLKNTEVFDLRKAIEKFRLLGPRGAGSDG
jgi:hypothetical protein